MFKVRLVSRDPSVAPHEFGSTYALDATFRAAWEMFRDPEWDRFDRFEVIELATGQVVRTGARPKV